MAGQNDKSTLELKSGEPILSQVGLLGEHYTRWVHRPVSGQPRFFRSGVMECLSKVRWWIVPLVWGPILAGIILQCLIARQARTMAMAATFASGILLWQLMEYSIHRFLFHIEPRSQVAITLHFALHGCHHKYPWDKERLVFPPIPAALVAAVVYCVTQALLPKGLALPMFAGILAGYLAYDCIHYAIHHGGLPRIPYLMELRQAHLSHHFHDSTSGYGISSTLYDIFLGTSVPPKKGP
eukprot:jgi/Botrbrau1/4387/Bobra.105_2s0033.1